MSVIAIVSQKGGSGKTTLALHLATCAAYAKQQTCVIDTDPQATAAAWGDWRGDFLPAVVTSPPARLARTIENAQKQGVDLLVIDTPPHAEAAMREAIKAADLVLIPTRPRAFDLHALEGIADLVSYTGTPAHVVFNGVPARASKMLEEAKKAVAELGLETCPVTFGKRADFHRSSSKGEVASEVDADGKAAGEVKALWKWVKKALP
ncbi:ParA family partition ATPase [Aurantiacibacter poecillastricola]|uniref:ParA family partition ATPase n=1 Tax=Aurantiacibacter poecillastricola TaxID=3064385 RepID=UPI00273FB9C9|nr:ParA family partition ATPase [Aurantiacibacter sp. 219JJ12-13]MDP5261940.1 ParA family partition ATPase [Aurantiacibacter sp. 219JJ12-13]